MVAPVGRPKRAREGRERRRRRRRPTAPPHLPRRMHFKRPLSQQPLTSPHSPKYRSPLSSFPTPIAAPARLQPPRRRLPPPPPPAAPRARRAACCCRCRTRWSTPPASRSSSSRSSCTRSSPPRRTTRTRATTARRRTPTVPTRATCTRGSPGSRASRRRFDAAVFERAAHHCVALYLQGAGGCGAGAGGPPPSIVRCLCYVFVPFDANSLPFFLDAMTANNQLKMPLQQKPYSLLCIVALLLHKRPTRTASSRPTCTLPSSSVCRLPSQAGGSRKTKPASARRQTWPGPENDTPFAIKQYVIKPPSRCASLTQKSGEWFGGEGARVFTWPLAAGAGGGVA